MIKTLLNADEDPPPGTKVVFEETVLNPPLPLAELQSAEEIPAQNTTIEENASENGAKAAATENFEIPENARFFTKEAEDAQESASHVVEDPAPLNEDSESMTALMSEIEKLEPEDYDRLESEIANNSNNEINAESHAAPVTETPTAAETIAPPVEAEKTSSNTTDAQTVATPNLFETFGAPVSADETTEKKSADADEPTIFQSDYKPPTTAETIRNSGLAWSAGIVFFGAVIFMMIFGWFADLLFGSSPWGLVGGIILGGIIGFIQFFRITSQIFKK